MDKPKAPFSAKLKQFAGKLRFRKSGSRRNGQVSAPTAGQPVPGHDESSSTTTTAIPPPNQDVSLGIQPSKCAPGPLATSDASGKVDLWLRAYNILQTREPELLGDYEKHLASLQPGTAVGLNLSNSESVKSMVEQLLDKRKKQQWQISLSGHNINVREHYERLIKFVVWTDPVVQKAVSSQPYAALAWSGIFLFLQVSI